MHFIIINGAYLFYRHLSKETVGLTIPGTIISSFCILYWWLSTAHGYLHACIMVERCWIKCLFPGAKWPKRDLYLCAILSIFLTMLVGVNTSISSRLHYACYAERLLNANFQVFTRPRTFIQNKAARDRPIAKIFWFGYKLKIDMSGFAMQTLKFQIDASRLHHCHALLHSPVWAP